MAKENKYSIADFKKDFSSDTACLELIFDALHSRKCSCGGKYSLMANSRRFQCSKCRFKIAPTAYTIFHKSSTPLTMWFHAVFVFSNAKSGVSAKEMERQLGVTYKTAWRMLAFIRKSLKQNDKKLKGIVEMDEGYFGGKGNAGADNKNLGVVMKKKTTVIGAVERGGIMRAKVTPNATAETIGKFLWKNVENQDTTLMTDKSNRYDKVAIGYDRHTVNHKIEEYVRGNVYVNSIDGFWSHIKRSVKGTHKIVSKKYFQHYLDGFVFHYNNRRNDRQRFLTLLDVLLRA